MKTPSVRCADTSPGGPGEEKGVGMARLAEDGQAVAPCEDCGGVEDDTSTAPGKVDLEEVVGGETDTMGGSPHPGPLPSEWEREEEKTPSVAEFGDTSPVRTGEEKEVDKTR